MNCNVCGSQSVKEPLDNRFRSKRMSLKPTRTNIPIEVPVSIRNRSHSRILHSLIALSVLSMTIAVAASVPAVAAPPPELSALAKLPVKEITVFKDGHALVLHEGMMPTDAAGNVQMDYLPTPVLGTFWPYSADKNARLTATTASQRRVRVGRTALSVRELIEANPGADAQVNMTNGKSYSGRLLPTPRRSAEELEATGTPGEGDRLSIRGDMLLIKTATGTAALPATMIHDVILKGDVKRGLADEEFRNLLTLKLDWKGGKPAKSAAVGMMYLQKGVRWIPNYKVTIDGKGGAIVKLQATLINEMTDLNDVTANLVIGVPSFAFKETLDPIGFQQTVAQLSGYFSPGSPTGSNFSNSIMSQTMGGGRAGEFRGGFGGPPRQAAPNNAEISLGPDVAGTNKNEDLFIFTVKHLTLRKGERMTLPVSEYSFKYRDIYTLDVASSPPSEVRGSRSENEQQLEMLRMINAPKVIHKLRLINSSQQPLTTAPALIMNGAHVIAQGMTTYTSPNGEMDLTLTTAVDIKVKRSEKETMRIPNAMEWRGEKLTRVDLRGTIVLRNYQNRPIEIEIARNVLGNIGTVGQGGKVAMLNMLDDDSDSATVPDWWGWYSWPSWWSQFNGSARLTWKPTLAAGETLTLDYTWYYFH